MSMNLLSAVCRATGHKNIIANIESFLLYATPVIRGVGSETCEGIHRGMWWGRIESLEEGRMGPCFSCMYIIALQYIHRRTFLQSIYVKNLNRNFAEAVLFLTIGKGSLSHDQGRPTRGILQMACTNRPYTIIPFVLQHILQCRWAKKICDHSGTWFHY